MKKNISKIGLISLMCIPGLSVVASCGPSPVEDDNLCTGAGGERVVEFWHALNNVNEVAVRDLTNNFNAAHKGKNGICVNMTAQTNYETQFKNVTSAISSGGRGGFPDLATTYPDHVAGYYNSGVVVNMQKFASDPTIGFPSNEADPKNSYEDILPTYQKESTAYQFEEADFKAGAKGQMLSLPLNKSTEIMYYNKTFFDTYLGKAAFNSQGTQIAGTPLTGKFLEIEMNNSKGTPASFGLKDPSIINAKDPKTWWTWADVKKVGEVVHAITLQKSDLTDPNGRKYSEIQLANPGTVSDGVKSKGNVLFSYDSPSNLFVTLANQVNSYLSLGWENGTPTPTANFAKAEALKQYEMYKDLYTSGIATIPGLIGDGTLKYATAPFTTKYLFMSAGSIAGAALNCATDFEVGIAPIPQASLDNPKVIQQGTNVTMMQLPNTPVDEDQQKAVWEYVKFLTSYESNLFFATKTTYMPTRQSVIDSKEYKDFLAVGTAENKAMSKSIEISQADCFFFDPAFKGSGDLRSEDNAGKAIKEGLSSKSLSMTATMTAFYEKMKSTIAGLK